MGRARARGPAFGPPSDAPPVRLPADRAFAALLLAGPVVWAALATALPATPATLPPARVLVWGVLVAPVLEELAFRGALQGALLERPALARRRAGLTGANALASLAFAAAHLWSQSPLQALSVIAPSLAFGACRDRYASVVPGTLLHGFYNAGFLWLFGPG